MKKVKLINKSNGVGKESRKPWCRITLSCDAMDGTRSVSDFFVSPSVAAKVASINLDSEVYIQADLDENLHFNISDIREVSVKA